MIKITHSIDRRVNQFDKNFSLNSLSYTVYTLNLARKYH